MEKLLLQLVESAKKNRKAFKRLKEAVVGCQQFELAAELREIEKEIFPETDESKKAKYDAKNLHNAFAMVELGIEEGTCWLINETIKSYNEKGGDFSIRDASILMRKRDEIFTTL